MIKTNGINEVFVLRNSWHDKLQDYMSVKSLPFRFKTIEKIEKINNEANPCYLVSDCEKNKVKMMISEVALKYLNGIEVPDSNIGMYFKDYLPIENAYLLLNEKEHIDAVQFILNIETLVHDDIEYPFLDLVLKNLLDGEIELVASRGKSSWKFIIYGNAIERAINKQLTDKTLDNLAIEISTYMNSVEKMYQDTFIHKTIVKYVCNKFANYLEGEGLVDDANALRERAYFHDNSKISNKTEFEALTGIINDKSCLRDANSSLTSYKQDAIELHWKNNTHHPEHYNSPTEMSRIDRYEFVCDCCARSIQYGTDLLEFMKIRQEQRFHFPEIMFDEIMHSCKIVVSL